MKTTLFRKASPIAERLSHVFNRPVEILVPMDFSARSMRALQTALRFASEHTARITLLHVVEVNLSYRVDTCRIERKMANEAAANFARIIQQFGAYATFNTVIVKGRLSDTILRIARERKTALIIVVKRAHSFWSFFHRNTVGWIMEKASCDVLAVPEGV